MLSQEFGETSPLSNRLKSNRVSYVSSMGDQSPFASDNQLNRKSLPGGMSTRGIAQRRSFAGPSPIYDNLLQTQDLKVFFERVKILPQSN